MAFKKGSKKPENSGRKKGVTNGDTAKLRAIILGALDRAGGEDYLVRQADESPAAFLALRIYRYGMRNANRQAVIVS